MKILVLSFIRLYQKIVSPGSPGLFGSLSGCRFYPSCSEYSIGVIEKYGFWTGLIKSALRILKCGPWTRGGVNFP